MKQSAASLIDVVPPEVWAEGARFGWKPSDLRPLDGCGVLVTLEREPSRGGFAFELFPAGHHERAFYCLERVQVAYRDQLSSSGAERAWQLALMVFLARAADEQLGDDITLPALFGLRVPGDFAAPRSPTSCMFADSALNVDVSGELTPCCLFQRPLADEEGRPFRVPEVAVPRVLVGPDLTSVRAALEAGKQIPECGRCWRAEQHGRASKRMASPVAEARRILPQGVSPALRMLTLFPSSQCNLRCRTCDARASSSIAGEQKRLLAKHPEAAGMLGTSVDEIRNLPMRSWLSREPDAWAWIVDQLGGLERLEFLGGEPLLFAPHFDLLSACVELGYAHRISLDYATNGTQLPARARELWPRFKSVRVQVSLDAVGARFEYLRHPARWPEVEANMRALSELSPNVDVTANATTSAYNVLYLDELIEWSVQRSVQLALNPLGNPRHFDPRALSRPAKRAVRARLARVSEPASLAGDLAALADEMDSADWSEQELPQFFAHTQLLDSARGEDFQSTFPELAALLRET
jgi:organic radical activating enzyme